MYYVFYRLLSTLTLESWFTNLEQTPQNCSQQLPALYKRLTDGHKQNYNYSKRECLDSRQFD